MQRMPVPDRNVPRHLERKASSAKKCDQKCQRQKTMSNRLRTEEESSDSAVRRSLVILIRVASVESVGEALDRREARRVGGKPS